MPSVTSPLSTIVLSPSEARGWRLRWVATPIPGAITPTRSASAVQHRSRHEYEELYVDEAAPSHPCLQMNLEAARRPTLGQYFLALLSSYLLTKKHARG